MKTLWSYFDSNTDLQYHYKHTREGKGGGYFALQGDIPCYFWIGELFHPGMVLYDWLGIKC